MNINDLVLVEYQGQRLLTGKQLAEFYGTTTARIRDNFYSAKKHFVLERDYYLLEGDVLKKVREEVEERTFDVGISDGKSIPNPLSGATKSVRVYTVEGASRHCKMLNTPKAWEIFNELVTGYFERKVVEPPPVQDSLFPDEQTAPVEQTVIKTINAVDRADKLIAIADRLKDDDTRDKLYLQAASLINGKKLL